MLWTSFLKYYKYQEQGGISTPDAHQGHPYITGRPHPRRAVREEGPSLNVGMPLVGIRRMFSRNGASEHDHTYIFQAR